MIKKIEYQKLREYNKIIYPKAVNIIGHWLLLSPSLLLLMLLVVGVVVLLVALADGVVTGVVIMRVLAGRVEGLLLIVCFRNKKYALYFLIELR